MSSRSRSVAVASLFVALACSDGSGPEPRAGESILVVRSQSGQQALWQYQGTTARRVSPDTVRFVYSLARANDGRLAWISMRTSGSPIRYVLTEVAADGRTLRSVPLGTMADLYGPPAELS